MLHDCLAIRAGEHVLIVVDPPLFPIGRALVDTARDLGSETALIEMSERDSNGSEPPNHVAAAMLAADVVVAPTTKSLSHSEARRRASAAGARIATMPGVTEDMLVRTMSANYDRIRERSRRLAEVLTNAGHVVVSSEAGTDLSLVVEGRSGLSDDGDLSRPGAFGNLPAGEAFIAPVEGVASGRIAFDGSLWGTGVLDEPVVAQIEGGYAETFSGPQAGTVTAALEPYGREAFAVAELGIGTNDAARLSGNILEDEKILGTIHVAFGDNHTIGGTTRVASHQDGIVLRPTVVIDGRTILGGGRLLLDDPR